MTSKHIFHGGLYFIGDPCYVISNANWDEVIDNTGCFGLSDKKENDSPIDNWNDGVFKYKGFDCFASGTKWGDGCYYDLKREYEFPVDAGLIGIIPQPATDCAGMGIVRFFHEGFEVWEEDGVFHFGAIVIDTN